MAHGKLRVEKSIKCSGKLIGRIKIPILKEADYIVKNYQLGGDAPKQFIKAYFYNEGGSVRKASISSWESFIAKTAEKWYPHESVIEFMINRIGQELGLKLNEVRLVIANGQIRFLSKYFLRKDDRLVHGAEICGEHLGDMEMADEIAREKKTSRELFTFEFIKDAIRSVYPRHFEKLLPEFVKMITFDALVGNNDRHFYNWGVIDTKRKTGKPPTFAPIYDSARGLYWNESDEQLRHIYHSGKTGGKQVENYIKNACPRISIEANKQANHFELVDFLKRYSPEYQDIILNLACKEQEDRILRMLDKELFPMFIEERSQLIRKIIITRFERIRGA